MCIFSNALLVCIYMFMFLKDIMYSSYLLQISFFSPLYFFFIGNLLPNGTNDTNLIV